MGEGHDTSENKYVGVSQIEGAGQSPGVWMNPRWGGVLWGGGKGEGGGWVVVLRLDKDPGTR